jgi:hypothetical protein
MRSELPKKRLKEATTVFSKEILISAIPSGSVLDLYSMLVDAWREDARLFAVECWERRRECEEERKRRILAYRYFE